MEFLDEDSRPRFLFQSRPTASSLAQPQTCEKPGKPFLFSTISVSSILLLISLFFLQSEPFRSFVFWVSLSLLLGPFAPTSITGGDIRVGRGPILEPSPNQETETLEEINKRVSQRRQKPRRNEEYGVSSVAGFENVGDYAREEKKVGKNGGTGGQFCVKEEKEWTEEEIGVLKKQLVKHPVGKPGRWEAISVAFIGRHKLESVIKKGKDLGERKTDDGDSYTQFLKKRKPVDKRVEDENGGLDGGLVENVESRKESGGGGEGGVVWSAGEDIALLNALKTFQKDVAMRWEKIAAAVPGKSKAACVKRVADLKRDFRSAKGATES